LLGYFPGKSILRRERFRSSVASVGKLWKQFCLDPSGLRSWGPQAPASGCASMYRIIRSKAPAWVIVSEFRSTA
jgi:hypothetical protein